VYQEAEATGGSASFGLNGDWNSATRSRDCPAFLELAAALRC
jgi:hypothetical protein